MRTMIKTMRDRDKLVNDILSTRKRLQKKFINEKLGEDVLQYEAAKLFKPLTEAQEVSTAATTQKLDKVVDTLERLPAQLAIEENPIQSLFTERALPAPPKKDTIVDPDINMDLDILRRYGFKPPSQVSPSESEDIQKRTINYNRVLGQTKRYTSSQEDKDAITKEIKSLTEYRERLKLLSKGQELIVKGKGMKKSYKKPKHKGKAKPHKLGGTLKYYDDPDVLVQQFHLLVASKQAGNTGVDNEISVIIDELVRKGYITKTEAVQLDKSILH